MNGFRRDWSIALRASPFPFMKTLPVLLLSVLGAVSSTTAQQSRIVGGSNTTNASQYPYMTALVERGATPSSGQFCGAALVAPEWVLTAAHCLEGTPANTVDVWIGGRDLRNTNEGVRVTVSQIIMHPSFRETSDGVLLYDFCLLKLSRPVTERTPLPLIEAAALVNPGITSRVLGWGATREGGSSSNVLRQVDLPIVSLATAGGSAAGLGISHLAAGFASGGLDSCQGDSGGPMLVRNSLGDFVHAGTVSYGNGCARAGEYGIYGNTFTVKSWIEGYIGTSTAADDHGNSRTVATHLTHNSTTAGELEKGRDVDFFRIDLLGAGTLSCVSFGTTDVVGTLYSSSGTVLRSDDNSAGMPNFQIVRTATTSTTLFLRVSGRTTTTTGTYQVRADFTPDPNAIPITSFRSSGKAVAMNRTLSFGTVTVGAMGTPRTYSIANVGRGPLTISEVRITGTNATSFEIVTEPSEVVPAGKSTSFQIRCSPLVSGPVTALLEIISDDPARSPYPLILGATGRGITGDDHGNTREAATLVSVPSTTAGRINTGTDVDFFRLNLTSGRTLSLRTTGSVDTYGTLYNSSGTILVEDDDTSPSNTNFTIERFLPAGTYYLAVEGYSTRDTGAYSLLISE